MTTDCSSNYKFNTCCVQKLFLTFRTILVHNMFSLYSAKKRASDKDLPVLKYKFKYKNLALSQFFSEIPYSFLILNFITWYRLFSRAGPGVYRSWLLIWGSLYINTGLHKQHEIGMFILNYIMTFANYLQTSKANTSLWSKKYVSPTSNLDKFFECNETKLEKIAWANGMVGRPEWI